MSLLERMIAAAPPSNLTSPAGHRSCAHSGPMKTANDLSCLFSLLPRPGELSKCQIKQGKLQNNKRLTKNTNYFEHKCFTYLKVLRSIQSNQ